MSKTSVPREAGEHRLIPESWQRSRAGWRGWSISSGLRIWPLNSRCVHRHVCGSYALILSVQLLQTARRNFADGGERIRYTLPPLIASAIQLARRFKRREQEVSPLSLLVCPRAQSIMQEDDWESRLSTLFKFIHQIISLLYHKVEAPEICLHLFLLAAQVADDCRLEELAYEFFVQAFVIYEESISESRAQLSAITGVISSLQTTRVFGNDNYDTLITKAALHGSKLLKKSHQATAVLFASHMWWQDVVPGRPKDDRVNYEVLSEVDSTDSIRLVTVQRWQASTRMSPEIPPDSLLVHRRAHLRPTICGRSRSIHLLL